RNSPYFFLSAIRTTMTPQTIAMTNPRSPAPTELTSRGTPTIAPINPKMNPAAAPMASDPSPARQAMSHQTLNARCHVGSSSCICRSLFQFGFARGLRYDAISVGLQLFDAIGGPLPSCKERPSIDHRHRVDLDQTAGIGGEPHDLHSGGRRLGVAEIFAPHTVERVLVGEVGDEAVGG